MTRYVYDPAPDESPFDKLTGGQPGVTSGWVVIHNGPGPALIYKAALLTDSDGEVVVEATGDLEDVTIIDDRNDEKPPPAR